MRRTSWSIAALLLTGAALAQGHLAGNDRCWSVGIPGAASRPDITCTSLDESVLLKMRSASRAAVVSLMGVPGRPADGGLHFTGNDTDRGAYSGGLTVTFGPDERVHVVYAIVERNGSNDSVGQETRFIWNADGQGCSDFPGSQDRCSGPDG